MLFLNLTVLVWSVPSVELTNSQASASFNVRLLGYAPRYYDYKQKIDRVHGGFVGDLSHWVAPVSDQYILNYLTNYTGTSLDYSFFKINPATMNPIFALAASSLSTDQLLVNSAFDVEGCSATLIEMVYPIKLCRYV